MVDIFVKGPDTLWWYEDQHAWNSGGYVLGADEKTL